MRKQIAAANWKMNLTLSEGEKLIDDIVSTSGSLTGNKLAIFAVPFPYLTSISKKLEGRQGLFAAAQNIAAAKSGAYTGEVSATMLQSIGIQYAIIGHSERREYYHETNTILAEKLDRAFENGIHPIFCCGEPLAIREAGTHERYVETQLEESLFHLTAEQLAGFIIAYEPIWAIGTGKTASSDQAQDMHQHIRAVMANKYGQQLADSISILYGGSVKASNAAEIFGKPDVDGGLVGGASLVSAEFTSIIQSLS